MKIKQPKMGAEIIGRIPSLGVTKYIKNGTVITRSSTSYGRNSNTIGQFNQRQRMRHSIALWKGLAPCEPMFTEGKTAYNRFLSLANRLPVVYLPKFKAEVRGSLLMPGIPVSDGTLRPMQQTLGEVDGTPALITDVKATDGLPHSAFLLYTAEQVFHYGDCPEVSFKVSVVKPEDFVQVDGYLALVGSDFADEMKGWALVRLRGKSCSPQGIVTRCKVYEQYTTEEALQNAAKSYKGVKV
jgi:hypothetical protein